jgi:hypothetical protein
MYKIGPIVVTTRRSSNATDLLACTFALTLVVVLGLSTAVEAICVSTVRLAGDDISYRYAGAYVDSLAYADQGRNGTVVAQSKATKATTPDEIYTATVDMLMALELAAVAYECSASFIRPYKDMVISKTSDDYAMGVADTARKSAELAELAYLQLAKLTREYLDLMQAGGQASMEHAGKSAALFVKMQQSWDAVLQVGPAAGFFIVDPEPDAAGHLSRFRITQRERDDLVKSIDQAFGVRVLRPADENTPAPVFGAKLLREFLTQKGYTLRK